MKVLPPYALHLTFEDGTSGVVDGSRWVGREPLGVFERIRDPAEFAKAYVHPESGTVAWSEDLDLCPDVLYAIAHDIALPGIE